ncbi:hypothetical protein NQ315_003360 [Exocentrus adspersus]|uniref:Uncharacterized protein n=1 Tax=Exocentrus adspersus TaxID=1586481 RepID=A0AAV8VA18_9CUCU|nr:hypothetical protein NQ315_003360 [Exocentrus adspersus]
MTTDNVIMLNNLNPDNIEDMVFTNKKIERYTISIILFLMVLLCIPDTDAQLTFSRNWTGTGKRVLDNPESQYKISANTMCHFLVGQIRQMVTCDNPALGEPPFLYGANTLANGSSSSGEHLVVGCKFWNSFIYTAFTYLFFGRHPYWIMAWQG